VQSSVSLVDVGRGAYQRLAEPPEPLFDAFLWSRDAAVTVVRGALTVRSAWCVLAGTPGLCSEAPGWRPEFSTQNEVRDCVELGSRTADGGSVNVSEAPRSSAPSRRHPRSPLGASRGSQSLRPDRRCPGEEGFTTIAATTRPSWPATARSSRSGTLLLIRRAANPRELRWLQDQEVAGRTLHGVSAALRRDRAPPRLNRPRRPPHSGLP